MKEKKKELTIELKKNGRKQKRNLRLKRTNWNRVRKEGGRNTKSQTKTQRVHVEWREIEAIAKQIQTKLRENH